MIFIKAILYMLLVLLFEIILAYFIHYVGVILFYGKGYNFENDDPYNLFDGEENYRSCQCHICRR